MAKPTEIELPNGLLIPILYEDRAVMALDKPAGWLLAPESWDQTGRNLHLALMSSIAARDFWAKSRNLKYLRFIHRLDAETSGTLLMAKNSGVLAVFSKLFETRRVEKYYLAAVEGRPERAEWICDLPLVPDSRQSGRMQVGKEKPPSAGSEAEEKQAETRFRVLERRERTSLVEAHPITGRTHQIRVHLASAGHPVLGDPLYAKTRGKAAMGLRAVGLAYQDPFQKRKVRIEAPYREFVKEFGFGLREGWRLEGEERVRKSR